jgi:hypothetical protein
VHQVHLPATHDCPAWQVVPQPPQLFGSELRSAHVPPHFVKPLLQVKLHWPATQVAVAFGCGGQAVAQPPQWLGSELIFVSQPSLAFPLQSAKPD